MNLASASSIMGSVKSARCQTPSAITTSARAKSRYSISLKDIKKKRGAL